MSLKDRECVKPELELAVPAPVPDVVASAVAPDAGAPVPDQAITITRINDASTMIYKDRLCSYCGCVFTMPVKHCTTLAGDIIYCACPNCGYDVMVARGERYYICKYLDDLLENDRKARKTKEKASGNCMIL
jgi:ribosomal protein S27AE